jgi:hypothetical protein
MIYTVQGIDGQAYTGDEEALKEWVRKGRITKMTQVYSPADSTWKLAGERPELFRREPPIAKAGMSGCQVTAVVVFIAFGLLCLAFIIFGVIHELG